MPHVVINCYPGRSEEIKKDCADKVAELVADFLGCGLSSVSVAFNEVDKSDWPTFYKNEIFSDKTQLFVKPGYDV